MKGGDIIGVRGPFGNHFKIIGKKALVVGGGTGTAPLMMLTKKLHDEKVRTTVIEGARTRNQLLFLDQLCTLSAETSVEVFFTTDDGSYETKGLVTDVVEKILSSRKFDAIYACGTDPMILKVCSLAEKYHTPMQASLVSIMFCAMGICGSCVIGKYRVCKDGPVFDQKQLKEVAIELGKFKRDFAGRKVTV
jgi:dihydroorotate dehydrogenase electron transfer subunit